MVSGDGLQQEYVWLRSVLRARYYHPTLGIFPTLDPLEGAPERPLSLHGYGWVEGNVVNATDPTGEQCDGSPNRQGLFAECGGGGGGGLALLLIAALTLAASYKVYRRAVCLDDEALDLGLGFASESLLPPNISPLDEALLPHGTVTLPLPYALMPGQDLKQVEGIGRQEGINVRDDRCRRKWGAFVEKEKDKGDKGSKNRKGDFTVPELRRLAQEFLSLHPECQA